MWRLWIVVGGILAGTAAWAAPHAQLSAGEVDLGVIEQGKVVAVPLSIRNAGDTAFEIERVQFSCHCVSVEEMSADERRIEPGEEQLLPLRYDPLNYTGARQATIMVRTTDPAQPVLQATVKTTIVTPVVMTPASLRLGQQVRGASLQAELGIKPGIEGGALDVLAVNVPHPALEFAYVLQEDDGDEKNLDATFMILPTAPLGPLNTIVEATVRLDDREFPVRIPFSVNVLGDAVLRPPQVVSLNQIVAPGEPISTVTLVQTSQENPVRVLDVATRGAIRAVQRPAAEGATEDTIIDISAAEDAPFGPNAAEVVIFSTSKDEPARTVPVYFVVGSKVRVQPSSLAIVLGGDATPSAVAQIQTMGHAPEIAGVRTETKDIHAGLDADSKQLVVEYTGSGGAIPVSRYVWLDFSQGPSLRVPVVVYRERP